MFTTLDIELNGPVATIWMNRPDLHNAFDETLITELTAACMALDDDADVRVVVLAGRGKSFSAGADLNWMKRAANNGLDDNLNDARALAHMLRKRLHKAGVRSGFKAVFSAEPVREGATILCEEQNKKSNTGTISYLPALFGIGCASVVVRGVIGEL